MSVRATAAVAAVLAAGAAAGCSSAGGSATTTSDVSSMPIIKGLETSSLTIAAFPAIDSGGLLIATNQGLVGKEGLTVKLIPDYKSTQDTVDQVEAGTAQISCGDYVTYMNDFLGSKDSNLEIVAEVSVLQPNNLALMTGPDSKIKSLSQLEHKAIPISGPHDIGNLLIDSVLADNNVPITSVQFTPGVPLNFVPQKLDQRAFIAGPVPEPFVSEGEQQYGDQVLADLDQGATTNFPIEGCVVTRQWAAQHPNTLKAFATAFDEGQETADTNRVALQKALEGAPLAVPVKVASVISVPEYPTGIDPTQVQRVLNEMIGFKFFTGATLAKAKAFQVKNVVYTANLASANGQSNLIGS